MLAHGRFQAQEASRNQMMLQDKCTNQILYKEMPILSKLPCSPYSPYFCHHVHHMCPTHHIIPHIPHMCLTTPYYSSPSPYMSNHTILFLTRFPALNKSRVDDLVSYTSFRYGRIMSVCLTQSFPSSPPHFPNCICYGTNELPWALPPWFKLVL